MGYIREPQNIDLVVGPSILTEDTKKDIAEAIAHYRKTGQKPASIEMAIEHADHIGHLISNHENDLVVIKKVEKARKTLKRVGLPDVNKK